MIDLTGLVTKGASLSPIERRHGICSQDDSRDAEETKVFGQIINLGLVATKLVLLPTADAAPCIRHSSLRTPVCISSQRVGPTSGFCNRIYSTVPSLHTQVCVWYFRSYFSPIIVSHFCLLSVYRLLIRPPHDRNRLEPW